LDSAKALQAGIRDKVDELRNYNANAQGLINGWNQNATTCQSNINSASIPSLQQIVNDAQHGVDAARQNLTNIRSALAGLQAKIPQDQANINQANQAVAAIQNLINQANQNLTTLNNNKNILDGNVNTLRNQQNLANDNLAKAQETADDLKRQLSTATTAFQIARQAVDQARAAKNAADNAVNNVVGDDSRFGPQGGNQRNNGFPGAQGGNGYPSGQSAFSATYGQGSVNFASQNGFGPNGNGNGQNGNGQNGNGNGQNGLNGNGQNGNGQNGFGAGAFGANSVGAGNTGAIATSGNTANLGAPQNMIVINGVAGAVQGN
jgi:uncharacterized phage infection (PIP) family protein YhgE